MGVRARVETSGLRYYSEDSGFDLWRLGLEGRFVRVGPLTAFTSVDIGRLSQTNGIDMRFWGVSPGVMLRLSDAFLVTLGADILCCTGAGGGGSLVQRRGIELEPSGVRVGVTWFPLRFGL